MRHFYSFTICAVLALASLSQAQNIEILGEYRIGIVGQEKNNSIYQATHVGALDAALAISKRDSIDIEIIVLTPDQSQGQNQEDSLGQLFIENADGIIISPGDAPATHEAIRFAQKQGQKIVFFENDVKSITPIASIIANEFKAGFLAGKTIEKLLPTQARIAILMNAEANSTQQERLSGLRSAIGYKRIEKIVTTQADYFSAIEAIRKTEDTDRNDLISGWVFLDDWPLLGMPAFPWRAGERPCVAIQSSPSAFMHLDQGYLDALIVHAYYDWGYKSVETLIESLHNNKVSSRSIETEPQVIDRLNIQSYRNKWQQWLQ
jgi:ABC-type sugar transport system substrate-binding protein